ncbi:MAG: type II toxin-antitoxin system RelE/ParE family toxin [Azonexus sp.]|jgi:toxin ParE1/3/4|nr:type II toxin-antitoxin system RelE/ParE family toxin [Azonexus sp.]
MLPIIWSNAARNDLRNIIQYIAKENPAAARRIKKLLENSVLPTAERPYLYQQSERVAGTRKIVAHPNDIIVYRVDMSTIKILRVMHVRQEYP